MATPVVALGSHGHGGVARPTLRRHGLWPIRERETAAARAPRSGFPCPAPIQSNDNGRNRLVIELFPLVKQIALRMREHLPAHIELNDLIGAGVLGLIDAVRKFDARMQVKIQSYARHRIRGAILDSLRVLDFASRDMRQKSKKAERVYHNLEGRLARPVGDAEMAQALGVSLTKWYCTLRELQALGIDWLRPLGSGGAKVPKEANEETLVAGKQENQFDLCYRQEQRAILNRALAHLPERERLIVWLYYGEGLTMKQIGAKLGIDESRVSQIHSAALLRLKMRVQGMLRPPRPIVPFVRVASAVTAGC